MKSTLRSLLALATAAAAMLSTMVLSAAPAAAAFTKLPTLTYARKGVSEIPSLKTQIGTTTLSTILTSKLNRTMVSGSSCAPAALSGISALTSKLCFDTADQAVIYWRPQGVAGTPERMPDATQDWGSTGKHPLIVAWYDYKDDVASTLPEEDGVEKGVRISIIDPSTLGYRHILLAEPYTNSAGHASFKALAGVHASGLAWIGDFLYVTDANHGLRVFDFGNLLDLSGSTAAGGLPINRDQGDKVGRQSSVWYTFGYSYVLPQMGTWKITDKVTDTAANGYACDNAGVAPSIDFADTDRTNGATGKDNPLLVTGEYCRTGRFGTMTVWDFLKMHNYVKAGTAATVTAKKNFDTYAHEAQGGTMVSGARHLITDWACGAATLTAYNSDGGQTFSRTLPYGSEDAMYDRATKRIYSVTEQPTSASCGGRVVFSVAAP